MNQGPRTRSKVRFHVPGDEPPPEPESDRGMNAKNIPIKNIHRSVTCGTHQPYLGFLDGVDRTRVYLHVEAANQTTDRAKVDGLGSAIKSGISRPERLRIGLTAAFLVVGMGESPWLKPDWTSEDFCLWTDSENLMRQPHLLHNSLLDTLQKAPKSQGRTSLYLLGILLLELVFGESFEDQSFRDNHLGNDGRPNEMAEFCTAMEWKTQAQQEVGLEIADGIGWCLGCLHGPPQDVDSPKCLKSLWQNVIVPLESFLEQWFEEPTP